MLESLLPFCFCRVSLFQLLLVLYSFVANKFDLI